MALGEDPEETSEHANGIAHSIVARFRFSFNLYDAFLHTSLEREHKLDVWKHTILAHLKHAEEEPTKLGHGNCLGYGRMSNGTITKLYSR